MQKGSSSSVRVFYPKLSRAEVIQELSERLAELERKLPLVQMVLFGSYANGRYTVGSDIDLLIIYEGEGRPDAYALVKQTLDLPRLEPHLYSKAEYEKLHETIYQMAKEGIVLFSRESTQALNNSKRAQLIVKRLLDVAVSVVGLLLLAIPFALIAVAIKLDSRGPIFFRQERVGLNGRSFRTWKFRTMAVDAPKEGFGHYVTENNPYITKVGRILRAWGLDELPQFINVLLGQMSLVGPRPVHQWQIEQYSRAQSRRLSVKPGITGWALIHGRNRLPWRKRIELDLWYVDNWSLGLDMKILLKTLWVVLVAREGVYGEGEEVEL